MHKRGLPSESLALLKRGNPAFSYFLLTPKAAVIFPEHQKLKERIASLEKKLVSH
jgi:hypothetical protein